MSSVTVIKPLHDDHRNNEDVVPTPHVGRRSNRLPPVGSEGKAECSVLRCRNVVYGPVGFCDTDREFVSHGESAKFGFSFDLSALLPGRIRIAKECRNPGVKNLWPILTSMSCLVIFFQFSALSCQKTGLACGAFGTLTRE